MGAPTSGGLPGEGAGTPMNEKRPLVCAVEDDPDLRQLLERCLSGGGYRFVAAEDPVEAEALILQETPDLILLDVMMPKMNGYDFCSRLQLSDRFAAVPVVFLTALQGAQDRARAFSVGAVDFLPKPVSTKALLEAVARHLGAKEAWSGLAQAGFSTRKEDASEFGRFKTALAATSGGGGSLEGVTLDGLYALAPVLGLTHEGLARLIAKHLGLDYCSQINPDSIALGVLPAKFSLAHEVVALRDADGPAFVVGNPFHLETLDILRRNFGAGGARILVTEPEKIAGLLKRRDREDTAKDVRAGIETIPIPEVGEHILEAAAHARASDIHIEPKEGRAVVRFRVDGDLRDVYALKSEVSLQVVSRFKALADLDVAERRRPQDGAMDAQIDGRPYIIRLATTSTPHGESLVMRLLEPWAKAKTLGELGMSERQVSDMVNFARRNQGMVLIAGPTGSGKTTTIYSLLQHIDCAKRSLMSIEDPVEYRILAANQQQVDEKAGLTFEALLKSALRQDPDILFLGEMRDPNSSKMAVDFASTGHLTISTLHTANATTAIFRLERVGITRGAMADSILGVIAQKLIKRLCPDCRKIGEPTAEEIGWLSPFTDTVPERVARPAGCEKCFQTGFLGREGVYEIVKFYPEISEMIRRGSPISDIRDFARQRGDYLISQHAVEKVRNLLCSPRVVYESVLIEEIEYRGSTKAPEQKAPSQAALPAAESSELIGKPRETILVVEDDAETRVLIERVLANRGYETASAADGVQALQQLSLRRFDLILSDIDMPNLDGLKLMEMKAANGIATPVVFLTARTETEAESKALDLGAVDYIRKPVSKEVLLARVKRALAL